MKFTKVTLAAALVTAFASSAIAGDVSGTTVSLIANGTVIGNAIGVAGTVGVKGDINVLSESGAVLDTEQTSNIVVAPSTTTSTPVGSTGGNTGTPVGSTGGTTDTPVGSTGGDTTTGSTGGDTGGTTTGSTGVDPNTASISGGAGNNAQGNVAVNVTAGSGNGQSNAVALSAIDAQRVFASAQSFSSQHSTNTMSTANDVTNQAFLVDALSNSRGNVSANVAGGEGNLQENQLAASVNSNGTLAKATGSNLQDIRGTVSLGSGGVNSAALGGGALTGAQGNIGANIAAGVSNAQHNSLSIATASTSAAAAFTGGTSGAK